MVKVKGLIRVPNPPANITAIMVEKKKRYGNKDYAWKDIAENISPLTERFFPLVSYDPIMCYNYSINKESRQLEERFNADFEDENEFSRVYHVSAFDDPSLPVITNENPDRFTFLQWGLIPFWVKDEEKADEIKDMTGNARAESIFEKPSFKRPIREKRCLVPADGFFEWREVKGRNYPHYIKMKDGSAFAFAGIWDEWRNDSTERTKRTFSIITTEANPLLEKVHNKKKRMPVILKREDEERWLADGIERDEIDSMLVSYEEDEMEAYPIRRLITKDNVDDNVPEVLEKYGYPELEYEQEELF